MEDKQEEVKPYWRCEECGYEDRVKKMPPDRDWFYSEGKPARCKQCKSEAMMPVGY